MTDIIKTSAVDNALRESNIPESSQNAIAKAIFDLQKTYVEREN